MQTVARTVTWGESEQTVLHHVGEVHMNHVPSTAQRAAHFLWDVRRGEYSSASASPSRARGGRLRGQEARGRRAGHKGFHVRLLRHHMLQHLQQQRGILASLPGRQGDVRGGRRGVLVTGYCRGEVEVGGTAPDAPPYHSTAAASNAAATWRGCAPRASGTGSAGSAARTGKHGAATGAMDSGLHVEAAPRRRRPCGRTVQGASVRRLGEHRPRDRRGHE